MEPLIFFGAFALFIVFVTVMKQRKLAAPVQQLDNLEQVGVRARGLVLDASQYVVAVTINGRRFEKRTMTLDVDIPGQAPYQSNGTFLVPRGLVEAIPGASLELAVDPSDTSKVVVLGPGGFTGPWIRLGPPQPF